jgi:hypothetical protein
MTLLGRSRKNGRRERTKKCSARATEKAASETTTSFSIINAAEMNAGSLCLRRAEKGGTGAVAFLLDVRYSEVDMNSRAFEAIAAFQMI